jgi:membrane protein DedA with SNARE-associated domain
MMKFLLGVLVGILIFFFFVWFGGGKSVKKIGEGLSETGKKIEVMEETIKKEKDGVWTGVKSGVKKKILKEEKETQKKSQ